MDKRTPLLLFLIITAFTSGTLIMVIEVLGSRIISPFFGVSLFVWTSLIAVTMIALATGYIIGGFLSDRTKSPDILYILLGFAGVFALIIPYVKIPVLKLCLGFGLRGGAFAGSTILFAPSLTLLGCVSPFVIRLATRKVSNVGRTVGFFYALSTIGSVLGTVLTGFILVAYLGTNNIFFLVGFSLIILAVSYFMFFRGKLLAVVSLLPFILLPFILPASIESKILENGTKVTVVAKTESIYGNIKVLDYTNDKIAVRQMAIDGLIQGGIDLKTGLSVFGYSYLMQYVPVAYNPDGQSCLIVGLGTGILPRWYMAQGIETDVVDIDPAVVEMASKHFSYSAGDKVIIEDARHFLVKGGKKYDYIILDVFNGDVTPSHVLSLEAFKLIKNRLTESGVFAMNIAGSLDENSLMTASVIKTLEAVFDQVKVIPVFNAEKGRAFGNLAVFAHGSELAIPQKINILPLENIYPRVSQIIHLALEQRYSKPKHSDAIILTDEYNPMDFYDMKLKENVRKLILQGTDWDILLS